VKSLDQPSSDVRKIYPTALLLRVWTASQAIRSLLRDGFNDDAFAGVRTMLEIEFQLSAISKKPELTKQLVRENEHYRGRRLQNLLKHKIKLPDEFQESEIEVEIQRIEAEQKALGAKPLTKREIAKVGECLTDFETIYSYLSDIVHVSPMGLAEYVSVGFLSKVATLRYGTAPLPMQYAFLWNSSILLRCLALVSHDHPKGSSRHVRGTRWAPRQALGQIRSLFQFSLVNIGSNFTSQDRQSRGI